MNIQDIVTLYKLTITESLYKMYWVLGKKFNWVRSKKGGEIVNKIIDRYTHVTEQNIFCEYNILH